MQYTPTVALFAKQQLSISCHVVSRYKQRITTFCWCALALYFLLNAPSLFDNAANGILQWDAQWIFENCCKMKSYN